MAELYSNKIVRENLEKEIEGLTKSVRYSSMAISNSDLEQRGDFRRYVKDSELLERLQEKLDELTSRPEDESYVNNEKIEKRDREIAELNDKLREAHELAREMGNNAGLYYDKKSKKLAKKIETLKKKRGKLEQKQYIVINRMYLGEVGKMEKESAKLGRDTNLERKIDKSTEKLDEATDYLDNFEWSKRKGIVKVAENVVKVGNIGKNKTVKLISKFKLGLLNAHVKALEKKDGIVSGAKKLPSKIAEYLKIKVQEIYSSITHRGSR